VSSGQEQGILGRLVGGMIRRSVRRRFRAVYWSGPVCELGDVRVPFDGSEPVIFAANHHGWHDGYLMFHLVTRLGTPALDWIAEFDAFPLFAKVGGMPFPVDDPLRRAMTVRRTIERMQGEGRSLVLFAEGTLHRPPELLAFGDALGFVARKVPGVRVVPVAILYDMSMHERPEAFLRMSLPVAPGPDVAEESRSSLVHSLEELRADVLARPESFEVLVQGTRDVNERWDMRRARP